MHYCYTVGALQDTMGDLLAELLLELEWVVVSKEEWVAVSTEEWVAVSEVEWVVVSESFQVPVSNYIGESRNCRNSMHRLTRTSLSQYLMLESYTAHLRLNCSWNMHYHCQIRSNATLVDQIVRKGPRLHYRQM